MKVRISELEKRLKEIDKSFEIRKREKDTYEAFIGGFGRSLCKFKPGTIEGLCVNVWSGDSYRARDITNKLIETIPYLIPDDYKEPTKEEIFEEFTKEAKDKGFHLTRLPPSPYRLEFNSQGRRWFVGEFYKDLKSFNVVPNVEAPIDKYLEGMELLIKYVKKARSLKLYKILLPGLITTDWKQQYLSEKDGFYFASRKNGSLKQRWTKEELEEVPGLYREYAVEVEDEV